MLHLQSHELFVFFTTSKIQLKCRQILGQIPDVIIQNLLWKKDTRKRYSLEMIPGIDMTTMISIMILLHFDNTSTKTIAIHLTSWVRAFNSRLTSELVDCPPMICVTYVCFCFSAQRSLMHVDVFLPSCVNILQQSAQ